MPDVNPRNVVPATRPFAPSDICTPFCTAAAPDPSPITSQSPTLSTVFRPLATTAPFWLLANTSSTAVTRALP
jgi:hypothetical protein